MFAQSFINTLHLPYLTKEKSHYGHFCDRNFVRILLILLIVLASYGFIIFYPSHIYCNSRVSAYCEPCPLYGKCTTLLCICDPGYSYQYGKCLLEPYVSEKIYQPYQQVLTYLRFSAGHQKFERILFGHSSESILSDLYINKTLSKYYSLNSTSFEESYSAIINTLKSSVYMKQQENSIYIISVPEEEALLIFILNRKGLNMYITYRKNIKYVYTLLLDTILSISTDENMTMNNVVDIDMLREQLNDSIECIPYIDQVWTQAVNYLLQTPSIHYTVKNDDGTKHYFIIYDTSLDN
ncbi:hypothetical protein WA158_006540 [Blastocystis sp. Blastoise]